VTRVALKGLAARKLRTALTALAIVLGVALVSAAFTLTDTMRTASDSLSSSAYDGTDAVVSAKLAFEPGAESMTQAPPIPASVLDRVKRIPGVTAAAGDISDEAQVIGRDGKPVGEGPYFGVGLDSKAAAGTGLTPFALEDGRWAAGPGEVVLDVTTAEDQGLGVGEQATVAVRGGAEKFTVVGTATFGDVKSLGRATVAVFDLAVAQDVFAKEGFDSILVAGDSGVRRAVAQAVGADYRVQTGAEHDRFELEGLDAFIGIIRIVLIAFGGIAVLVGAFTIFNTLSITVAQRARELGLLRMVGASRRQVLRSVLLEALVLGIGASVVGVLAGFGLAKLLEGVFASLGLALPDAGTVFAARTVVVALAVGTLATLVAGLVPAIRATRVAPVAALRDASDASARTGIVARAIRGAVSILGRPAELVGGSAGRLARRNATRNPGRTLATSLALVIGVALVTLVTIVAAGLKDTTKDSLTERITASHVVTNADGWSPIDQKIDAELRNAAGIRAVSSLRTDGALAAGDEEAVNIVDPKTITSVFDFEWAEGSATTLRELGTTGAVVDEGWAKEQGLGVGDAFSITTAKGKELALEVRGIESSPILDALGLGPITVSTQAAEGAFAAERNRMTLVQAEDRGALERTLAAFPDAKVQTTGAYADEQAAVVDTLLAIFAVLLALCVLVSLFGIVNALVLAGFERTRELGTLRALGMSRRQMRRMVRHEGIVTALLGAALGITAGLGLALAVTSAFADEGLAFTVPVPALALFVGIAVLAGILAAVLPARRAARLNVLDALAYE
jgi:putative ABC transport system permease protein